MNVAISSKPTWEDVMDTPGKNVISTKMELELFLSVDIHISQRFHRGYHTIHIQGVMSTTTLELVGGSNLYACHSGPKTSKNPCHSLTCIYTHIDIHIHIHIYIYTYV